MNNAKTPTLTSVDVSLFGGLYTEANPADLPEGASPQVINKDFIIGTVQPRPGKRSLYYYTDFFSEKTVGFAESVAGTNPNEVPWLNPLNATLDTPGSYASATLNLGGGGGLGGGYVDSVATATGAGTAVTVSATPTIADETAFFFGTVRAGQGGITPTTPSGWSTGFISTNDFLFTKQLSSGSAISPTSNLNASGTWAAALVLFYGQVSVVQATTASGGISGGGTLLLSGTVPGNAFLVSVLNPGSFFYFGGPQSNWVISDNQTNPYTNLGTSFNDGNQVTLFYAPAIPGGSVTLTYSGDNPNTGGRIIFMELTGGTIPPSGAYSEILRTLNFPFSIPDTVAIFGFEVEVSGHQTSLANDAILTVSLVIPATGSPEFNFQLPAIDGTTTVATPTEKWGLTMAASYFNNPNNGLKIIASAVSGTPVTFDVYAVKMKVFISPDPPPSINYLKTFSETGGEVLTLALGSDGVIYQEDAINNPGALTGVYTAVEPDTFGQSCTQSDREFIALSNLRNGTDIPYSYDGVHFDRLSQVGPGTAPSVSTTSVGTTVVSITQKPAKSDPEAPGRLAELLWSTGPGVPSPGNVLTVYYARVNHLATPDPDLQPGATVALAGVAPIKGQTVDGVYTITSTGQGIPPSAQYIRWFFTVVVPTTQYSNSDLPVGSGPTGTYQVTIATMTTTGQIPNLEVGNQFQLSGTGGAPAAGYDGAWTVLATPNAAQVQIASTSLLANIATYAFNLISGTAPVAGQAITITQTLNGNGIFNVTNAVISTVTPGTFSIPIFGTDVSSSPESGAGIIFGTIFQFDPLAIVGNKLGGSIFTSGVIGQGRRKICYSFLTRHGYITQPSPIVEFDVPSGTSSIAVADLATGPSNVVARIIHSTAAEGGNFYNIPQPVTVTENGVDIVNSSTWINDNTTTNVILSFADAVLLSATPIDVQGNNLFETAELGSSIALIPYASRLFSIGEQNKLTNLLNWSFDGGTDVGDQSGATFPLGWTVDPTDGAGGSVIASPIFGSAYSILNSSGITQATYGMITQPAFQDEFEVPIIVASTTYSVRVTAAVPTGPTTGNLVVDLYNPSFGRAVGTFTLNLAAFDTTMLIFSGTLLTTVLAPVPTDLILRLYATALLNGAQITIDRIEIFPTEDPNLSLQVTGSYVNNFEAFDQLDGVISGAIQNQQPIRSAFTLYDALYLVKTSSLISTQDNGTTEPSGWSTRVISNSVGTPSIYGVTTGIDEPNAGEEWAIIAGEAGGYLFNGGQPIKITEEIQSLWDQINWAYGHTLWVKNDIVHRRILFAVPLKTPNDWLPTGIITDDQNPTTPNVILALNYKQLNTASALADRVGVHTSYAGKLTASDLTRKWSIWTIKAPCAAFITRANTTTPLFLGNSNGTGKIYDLVELQLNDDGTAFDQRYITYGFVTPDQEQALQIGSVRKMYEYMTLLLDGVGSLQITVYPNSLDGPYSHDLLPAITLPGSTNGDTEVPVNETASRLFVRFRTNAVDEGFSLSKMMFALRQDPWSPVRGRN